MSTQSAGTGHRGVPSRHAAEPARSADISFTGGIAFAHLFAKRYAEAVEWADRSLHERPTAPFLRVKVVACANLGRIEEGRELLQQVLKLQPGLTIAGLKAYPGMSVTPEITSLFAEGFRKVGLPEE